MINDHENLKDAANNSEVAIKDNDGTMPYNKANKLITALFMVTDILDKDEPIRAKLRILGMDVISDVHTSPAQAKSKIDQIMAFLDIASTMGMVSPMNAGILKKEFTALNHSLSNSNWLEKFILSSERDSEVTRSSRSNLQVTDMTPAENIYQGHKTRIGVQKGSTLLTALGKVNVSDKNPIQTNSLRSNPKDNFDLLKKQRRDEIIKVITEDKEARARGGATITDIKNGAKNFATALGIKALASCGEKTLQRELVSMVKDKVLNKAGEKRWSKYFLPR